MMVVERLRLRTLVEQALQVGLYLHQQLRRFLIDLRFTRVRLLHDDFLEEKPLDFTRATNAAG